MANSDIHVMAGVMQDTTGRVLVAQRPAHKSMAGAWEFPGGKIAPKEGRVEGLARELNEELGIRVEAARPLLRYLHNYADFVIDLDVWRVTDWQGIPKGRENQALAWHFPEALLGVGLLPADTAVVRAIRLPPLFSVTPPSAPNGVETFLDALESSSAALVCMRRPDLDAEKLLELAAGAACRIEDSSKRLVLHGEPAELVPLILEPPSVLLARLGEAVAGLHVPARHLARLTERPLPESLWFGVSCHDAAELKTALALGADYAFLGPVKPTDSHPGKAGIGWETFSSLVADLPLPTYAIGGLTPDDLETAWAAGAQGIAGIRSFWPDAVLGPRTG